MAAAINDTATDTWPMLLLRAALGAAMGVIIVFMIIVLGSGPL
jgi:hypothetical protein